MSVSPKNIYPSKWPAAGLLGPDLVNKDFGYVFISAVGAVELPPVGVGVGIDRNRTSPARLSECLRCEHHIWTAITAPPSLASLPAGI